MKILKLFIFLFFTQFKQCYSSISLIGIAPEELNNALKTKQPIAKVKKGSIKPTKQIQTIKIKKIKKPTIKDPIELLNKNESLTFDGNLNISISDIQFLQDHEIESKYLSKNNGHNVLFELTKKGDGFYFYPTIEQFNQGLFDITKDRNVAIHLSYAASAYFLRSFLKKYKKEIYLYGLNYNYQKTFLHNQISEKETRMQYLFPTNSTIDDQTDWLKATSALLDMLLKGKINLDIISIQTIPISEIDAIKDHIYTLSPSIEQYEDTLNKLLNNNKEELETFFSNYGYNYHFLDLISQQKESCYKNNNYGILILIKNKNKKRTTSTKNLNSIFQIKIKDSTKLTNLSEIIESHKKRKHDIKKRVYTSISDILRLSSSERYRIYESNQNGKNLLLEITKRGGAFYYKPTVDELNKGYFDIEKQGKMAIHFGYAGVAYFIKYMLDQQSETLKTYFIFRNSTQLFKSNGINEVENSMQYLFPINGSLDDKIEWLKITSILTDMFLNGTNNSKTIQKLFPNLNELIMIQTISLDQIEELEQEIIKKSDGTLIQTINGVTYKDKLIDKINTYKELIKKLYIPFDSKEIPLDMFLGSKNLSFKFFSFIKDSGVLLQSAANSNPYGVLLISRTKDGLYSQTKTDADDADLGVPILDTQTIKDEFDDSKEFNEKSKLIPKFDDKTNKKNKYEKEFSISEFNKKRFDILYNLKDSIHDGYSAVAYSFKDTFEKHYESFRSNYHILKDKISIFDSNNLISRHKTMAYLFPVDGTLEDQKNWLKLTAIMTKMFIDSKDSAIVDDPKDTIKKSDFNAKPESIFAIQTIPLELYQYLRSQINKDTKLKQTKNNILYKNACFDSLEFYGKILKLLSNKPTIDGTILSILLSNSNVACQYYGFNSKIETFKTTESFFDNPFGVLILIRLKSPIYTQSAQDLSSSISNCSNQNLQMPQIIDSNDSSNILTASAIDQIKNNSLDITKNDYAISNGYKIASDSFQSILQTDQSLFNQCFGVFRDASISFENNSISKKFTHLFPASGSLIDQIDWLKIISITLKTFIDGLSPLDGKDFKKNPNDMIAIQTIPLDYFNYLKSKMQEIMPIYGLTAGTPCQHVVAECLNCYESIIKKLYLEPTQKTVMPMNIYLGQKNIIYKFYGFSPDFDLTDQLSAIKFNPYGVMILIRDFQNTYVDSK